VGWFLTVCEGMIVDLY